MAYIDTEYLGKCETCRHNRSGSCNTFCDCGEEYSPDLSKIPTADVVEVKHGVWIGATDSKGVGYAKCSACGGTMSTFCYGQDYCGLCGAKMDGKGDSDGE